MSQYVRDRWGAARGFPGGQVHAITQTADGYLWIGTDEGLVQFDGSSFRVVPTSSDPSSSREQVLGLATDVQGALWVMLPGPNVLRHHGGVFESALSSLRAQEDAITAIRAATDGTVLLAGLVNGTVRYSEGSFQPLAPINALPRSPVISMAEGRDGKVWLGTRDAGLYYVQGGHVTRVGKGLPDTKVNCLLPIDDRNVWIGTDRGIARWDGAGLTAAGLPPALGRIEALALMKDRGSNVWIGTGNGLLRVNAGGVSALDEDGASAAITALFEDREGHLWAGSAGAIERLSDSIFTSFGRAEGLPSPRNGPIAADAEGRTWFAPTDGGLFWLRDGRVERVTVSGLGADVVYSIAAGRAGVWVGRQRGGLTNVRVEGPSPRARSYTTEDGLAQDSVYAVHESRDGTVWAGTLGAGVSRLRNGRIVNYTVANGLASDTVASILDGADGTTWFATPNGLSALASEAWRAYTVRDGLPSDDVSCLLEDPAGVLWIGTHKGLAFLRSGRIHVPRDAPPSLRRQVFGIALDRGGWLWVAAGGHVLRVDRQGLIEGRLDAADVAEYGPADGLHGTEGARRHRSVVADERGRIWFSLDRGLSMVDPTKPGTEPAPPIAHIMAVSADGTGLVLGESVRVPAGHRRITIRFAGLSLSVPERVRFRYRLEGFDRSWSEPIAARDAVYTNLGPGSYRFRVAASNRAGLWSGAEASLRVVIEPAVWQTWWFRLAAALSAVLALFGAYRLRLRRLAGRLNMRFEERLAERTRIAQELHDTLLQGVLSASMQLHLAVDELPEESPHKPRLGRVLALMGHVIGEARNAVRGLRSPEGPADDLEQAFSRIQQELGLPADGRFRVVVEGAARPLHPVIRDEVYRIGREALVNAFRHSRAHSIEVELRYTPAQLRVLVRDDGRGIDPEVLRSGREGHWGLAGMRERAEKIGARLRLWSRASAGTEVELSVPGHVAYPPAAARRAGEREDGLPRSR